MKKCENGHAYVATIVLVGVTLEYILSAWMRAFPEVVYSQDKRFSAYGNLKDLNRLAYESGLFDFNAFRRGAARGWRSSA